MEEHGSEAYLVNTGWCGGGYGVGSRIKLSYTRAIIDAILNGDIETVDHETSELFQFEIPKSLPGVPSELLNPANAWPDKKDYQENAEKLARQFKSNFEKFTVTPLGKSLVNAGPKH